MKRLLISFFLCAFTFTTGLAQYNFNTGGGASPTEGLYVSQEFYDWVLNVDGGTDEFQSVVDMVSAGAALELEALRTFLSTNSLTSDTDELFLMSVLDPSFVQDLADAVDPVSGPDPNDPPVIYAQDANGSTNSSLGTAAVVLQTNTSSMSLGFTITAYGGTTSVESGGVQYFDYTVEGTDGDRSTNIPIDGGLSFLALGGLAFGISRIRRNK